MELDSLLPVILGAGGVAFIGTVFQFISAWKNSAETREAKAVGNLEKWRDEADHRALQCLEDLNKERDISAYWRRRTAVLEHACLRHGVEIPPQDPPPYEPV